MHVRTADHTVDLAVSPGEKAACLTRSVLAGVRDDLVLERLPKAQRVGYATPPAIAGMTMTSLPSGTTASVPPLLRASSSPMYTFT
jgi:hypothetical protein